MTSKFNTYADVPNRSNFEIVQAPQYNRSKLTALPSIIKSKPRFGVDSSQIKPISDQNQLHFGFSSQNESQKHKTNEALNGYSDSFYEEDSEAEMLIDSFVNSIELKEFLLDSRYKGSKPGKIAGSFIGGFEEKLNDLESRVLELIERGLSKTKSMFTSVIDELFALKKNHLKALLSFTAAQAKQFGVEMACRYIQDDNPPQVTEARNAFYKIFKPFLPYNNQFTEIFSIHWGLLTKLKGASHTIQKDCENFSIEKAKIRDFLPIQRLLQISLNNKAYLDPGSLQHVGVSESQPLFPNEESEYKLEDMVRRGPENRMYYSKHFDSSLAATLLKPRRQISTMHQSHDLIMASLPVDHGEKIFTGSADGSICLTDCLTSTNLLFLSGHSGPVRGLAYLQGTGKLLSCSNDCTIKVWDVVRKRCETTLTQHKDWVWGISELPGDSNVFVSISDDESVQFWSTVDFRWKGIVRSPIKQGFRSMAVVSKGENCFVYAGGWTIYEIDCQTQKIKREFQGHQYYVRSILFIEDNCMVSGGEDQLIIVWRVHEAQQLFKISTNSIVLRIRSLYSGRILVASTTSGLSFWNMRLYMKHICDRKLEVQSNVLESIEESSSLVYSSYHCLFFLQ